LKQSVLEFQVAQKEILNSNSIPSHFIVKGNMVSHLRDLAAQTGALYHDEDVQQVDEAFTAKEETAQRSEHH
jgi:hypothetical protein